MYWNPKSLVSKQTDRALIINELNFSAHMFERHKQQHKCAMVNIGPRNTANASTL